MRETDLRNASINTSKYLGMLFVGAVLAILNAIMFSFDGYPSVDNRIERNNTVLSILSYTENGNSTENIVVADRWKDVSCFIFLNDFKIFIDLNT